MSRIRAKDTQPELAIRRWLWTNGYRYRLHRKNLAGKPDITLARYKAVLFIHGCFWHRHGCQLTTTPSSRQDFWLAKFRENVNRDRGNIRKLREDGWRVMIIWECSIRGKTANIKSTGRQIKDFLASGICFSETNRECVEGKGLGKVGG